MTDITTAEQAIQEMGDALAHVMDQMLKGSWKDDHGHDVKNNVHMNNAARTLRRVMKFRTEHMNYSDVSPIFNGAEQPVVPAMTEDTEGLSDE